MTPQPPDPETVRARGTSFGGVAREYDRVRPGHLPALVDEVLAHAGTAARSGPEALEVGAGTGKATVEVAGRGVPVLAVEPDPEMAVVLRERCAGLPHVRVEVATFEDHARRARDRGGPGTPLLLSAQAWHWTDPATRWDDAAALLAPGGTLALFWNMDRIADPVLQEAVTEAHRDLAEEIVWATDGSDRSRLLEVWPGDEMLAHPALTDVGARLYRWQRTMSRADYVAYLATHSPYLALAAGARERLFAALRALLPDEVLLDEDTVLYLARRA